MPDGTVGYPETVLLRLIDSQGGENGAYIQGLSREAAPFIKIVNKDGREQVIKP